MSRDLLTELQASIFQQQFQQVQTDFCQNALGCEHEEYRILNLIAYYRWSETIPEEGRTSTMNSCRESALEIIDKLFEDYQTEESARQEQTEITERTGIQQALHQAIAAEMMRSSLTSMNLTDSVNRQRVLDFLVKRFDCFPQEYELTPYKLGFPTASSSNLAEGWIGKRTSQGILAVVGPLKESAGMGQVRDAGGRPRLTRQHFNVYQAGKFLKMAIEEKTPAILALLDGDQEIAQYWCNGTYAYDESHHIEVRIKKLIKAGNRGPIIGCQLELIDSDDQGHTEKYQKEFYRLCVQDNHSLNLDNVGRSVLLRLFKKRKFVAHCQLGAGRTGQLRMLKALFDFFKAHKAERKIVEKLLKGTKLDTDILGHCVVHCDEILRKVRQERFAIQAQVQLYGVIPQFLLLWAQHQGASKEKMAQLEKLMGISSEKTHVYVEGYGRIESADMLKQEENLSSTAACLAGFGEETVSEEGDESTCDEVTPFPKKTSCCCGWWHRHRQERASRVDAYRPKEAWMEAVRPGTAVPGKRLQ